MKNFLSRLKLSNSFFLLTGLSLFLFQQKAAAQCAVASFQGAGTNPYTPTTTFKQTTATGSGTYQSFNVVAGDIYSFYVSDSASTTPNPYTSTGGDWSLTLSQTSVALNYNDLNTPLHDSYTGGIGCPLSTQPSSAVVYSTFSGQLWVSLSTYTVALPNCNAYVPGQSSAVLNYRECVPVGDPGPGLSGTWNVEAFATTALSIPNFNARWGYYNDATSGLNFNTQNYWSPTGVPSDASGWTGCIVSPENFTVRARMKDFPCGLYQVSVQSAQDSLGVYINGVQIFDTSCCITSPVPVGNAAGYVLGANDIVEYRLTGTCGPIQTSINLVPATIGTINGGTIADTTNSTYACTANPLGYFANVAAATGGASAYPNGGNLTYEWQISYDGGTTWHNTGATTIDWSSADTVPAGLVYEIRREAVDQCGNFAYSNIITLIGVQSPNAEFSPTSQFICPGGAATLTVNFTAGQGPYNIYFGDGFQNYSDTGVNSGFVTTISPPGPATVTFTRITDSHGCTTTSYFSGGAFINIEPLLSIPPPTVINASCFGYTNGEIIVSISGGIGPYTYSDNNGGTFQSSNIFNNLAPDTGNYNIVVTDNIGCSGTYTSNPVDISQPAPLSDSVGETDASCSGLYNGAIIFTNASGGTPPYQYSLNLGPPQHSNVITGVVAGTYMADLVDNNGCVDSTGITVNNSYVVALVVDTFTNESCYGSGNGTAVVHLVGGTPPYVYSLNGLTYQSSDTFSGLVAGTYTFVGKDVKGCTESATITIHEPSQLTVLIDSIVNGTCASNGNGAIFITAQGGTPGYTYLWNNGTTTQNDTGLVGGRSYNVVVTDTNGCTANNGVFLAQTYPLSLNIALITNPVCSGDSAGAILATANGGVPPYRYAWSNGDTTQDIDSISAGSYTLTVQDASGCQSTISQTLNNPPVLTDVVTSSNVTCYGTNTGTASVVASGGVAPYKYFWSNLQATDSVSSLFAGLYNLEIIDNNGCQRFDTVRITQPPLLTDSLSIVNDSCGNTYNGSVTAIPGGGTPSYTYAWNVAGSGSTISGLAGGVYFVTVTDLLGCTVASSGAVIQPLPLRVTFDITNNLCSGQPNGSVFAIVTGGFPGYTYQWSNGFTTDSIFNLPGGLADTGGRDYIVTVSDTRNCTVSGTAIVTEPEALNTTGLQDSITCNGRCDGAIFTTAYGGTPPYSFKWSDSTTAADLTQVCAGIYFVTITDVNGCIVVSQYNVDDPAALTVNLLKTDNTCFGLCTGSLAAVPGGGTQPYKYLWNNFVLDSFQTNVCAGFYTLLLTDSNNCQVSDTASVLQPAQINITGVVTNLTCYDDASGAVTTTVTGGVTPYTFSWSNGATTQSISGVDSNTYVFAVTDSNTCHDSATFNVTQPPAINPVLSASQPQCSGSDNGFILANVTGGVTPYTYNWSTTPAQTGANATNLYAGLYTLTVTDQHGCSVTVSDSVAGKPAITLIDSAIGSKCFNTAQGEVIGTVISGGTPPFTFLLNGVLQQSDTFTNLAPGNYSVVVIDANGCEASDTFTIQAPPPFYVTLTTDNQFIYTGMTTQLVANATSSTPIVHYAWSPDSVMQFTDCPDSADCNDPLAAPQVTTLFTVTAFNADSCFVSDTLTIYVEDHLISFIPTAFTPNGDGHDDRFEFSILNASTIEISIYDRWGQRVYYNPNQANGMTNTDGWDGTSNGKPAPEGTYVYQMKITYNYNNTVKNLAGTIAIIR